ncbi:mycolipanoate synthase-like [Ambystoma mexicanum]|uniref:mycolipanoate synthase-like n=1 Tax=Ambystoma mexicanum TaxID=8296 RepID=UPI0037E7A4A9
MNATGDDIAIVGIGCNFPGGEGIDNFWKVLVEGKNCTVEIPPERFNTKDWYDPDDSKKGKMRTTRAALIDGFNEFDNRLFNINDTEAERMDPQHKLLLECTYRALECAGIPMESISGSDTGVFIGLMNRDLEFMLNEFPAGIDHYSGTGAAMSIAANRVSYCFNLTGPSLALDTACSSSLVALHYACHAIKQGDCEMALCGGVSCIIDPRIYVTLSKAKMISPGGMSKPFSKNADGYGRGEGCGIVLLKPLGKAIEDCDKIWGVISISAVNQDGRSITPITRPSQSQQERLLQKIYATQIDPSVVQYVEAHGTGTPVGDPTEAASLGNVVAQNRSPGLPPLKIGSVKGNIGHTESAAGVAGLIKVLLMMHHETIVPSLHYSEGISSINAKELNLSIPTVAHLWEEREGAVRMAGVNNFGFGGTNAHVVITQFKHAQPSNPFKRPFAIFVISASSRESLKLTIEDTAAQLNKEDAVSLQDLAYTSACRRSHKTNKYRCAFVIPSLNHLQQELTSASSTVSAEVKANPNIVFVFCGNGVNYKGMCKMLLNHEPVFRDKFKEIEDILYAYTSISLMDLINNDFDDFSMIEIAQPLLFASQVALVCLLNYWGIKPIALVGHSVGEVAAAHCSGLLSLKDAVKVIYHRSRLQSKATGGKMLVVGNFPVEELSEFINLHSENVCIAAFNSPLSCTLSGEAKAIEDLQKQLDLHFSKNNIFLLPLDVPAAYHSHMMDPILEKIEESLQDITSQKYELELISTVSGKTASGGDFATGKYWAQNVREPVLFTQAIQTIWEGKANLVFVEIGPKRALERNIKEIIAKETLVYPTVQPNKDYETIFMLLEKLFVQGHNPNWQHVYGEYRNTPMLYPRYQFDHTKTSRGLETVPQGTQRSTTLSHPLLHSVSNNNMEYGCTLSETTTPYIFEHKNNDIVIVPGSFYVELGIASVMNITRSKIPLCTNQVGITFSSPCIVSKMSHEIRIQLESQNKVTHFKILSTNAVYATGEITQSEESAMDRKSISLQHIIRRCKSVLEIDKMYDTLYNLGFQYGQVYRQLSDILYGEHLQEAVTSVTVNHQITESLHEYYIHPVVLDAFLQMTVIMAFEGTGTIKAKAGFPSSIGSIILYRPIKDEMMIYMKKSKSTQDYIEVCGCFSDNSGTILVELKNVRITFLSTNSNPLDDILYETEWEDISTTLTMHTSVGAPKSLVLADDFGIAQHLKQHLHQESTYIKYSDCKTELESGNTLMCALGRMGIILTDYSEFLFMWGIHRFAEEFPSNLIRYIAECSEAYRQFILCLREHKPMTLIRTITYRTTERTVDHINPGFGLQGMTRACAAEVPEVSFQQIDISSPSVQDITALANVIANTSAESCPEVLINEGHIYKSEIARTRFHDIISTHPAVPLDNSRMFTLYSTDPYKAIDVSAELTRQRKTNLSKHNIEVQVIRLCVHSEDYFPVSDSSYRFGDTLYWKSEATDKHTLLALDFTGTVTAIDKDIKNLKVGDHIVSCYPVSASSKVTLPADVCYKTKKVPFLKNVPCISYFWIAWMILHKILPKARGRACLGIVSSEPKSVLCEVLTLAANESGWKTITETPTSAQEGGVDHCNALVLLPSLDGMFGEDLAHLQFLKDVVIVGDTQELGGLQTQIGKSCDHATVHALNLKNIFQKTCLNQFTKPFYTWVKSLQTENFLNLQYSIFQQDSKADLKGFLSSSYFCCTSVPIIVLRDDVLVRRVSDIPMYDVCENMFKSDGVYMVTGGLSGLGFETVRFIAHNGGGYIVILSRRKPSTEMETEMRALQNQYANTTIISLQCNVVVRSDVENAVTFIHRHLPKIPVKGVFHSAVVFHDGLLNNLRISHFEEVLSPKVGGAINLHCATMQEELDYFICYSSITSFVGNAGQANYAAANSFLDNFCHYRRNLGLSAQSINWGALNLGVLLNQNAIKSILESKGILTLDIDEIHEYLRRVLILNAPQQAVMKLNFSNLNSNVVSLIPSLRTRFYKIVTEEVTKMEALSKGHVSNSPQDNPEDYISSLVSELSHASRSDITKGTLLTSLGIDSMVGMTLQNRIYHERNVKLPLVKLLDPETTVQSLVSILEENMPEEQPEKEAGVENTTSERTRL